MKHQWAALVMIPAEVEISPESADTINVYYREAAEEIGKEEAILLCWHCHTELTPSSYDTECVGAEARR